MPKPSSRAGNPGRPTKRFADPAVAAVFRAYPAGQRTRLMAVRDLIFATAAATAGVGTLTETLKWGQPSYLTSATGSGSTIRIDRLKPETGDGCALYFHCQTNLVETFRALYAGTLAFGGNRSILLDADAPLPKAALKHCIALALTYHARRTRRYL